MQPQMPPLMAMLIPPNKGSFSDPLVRNALFARARAC